MLLTVLFLLATAQDADAETRVTCVVHEKKPTIFTPKRECMTGRAWRKYIVARLRSDAVESAGFADRPPSNLRFSWAPAPTDRGIGFSTEPARVEMPIPR